MASVSKKGRSFSIRVSCGYDIRGKQIVKYKTFRPPEGMSEKQAQKEANRQAVLFEEECKIGHCQTGSIKFEAFAEQWFKEYAKLELRPTTYERMRKLTARVYPAIGHLKLDKISRRDIKLFILVRRKSVKSILPRSSISFLSYYNRHRLNTECFSRWRCSRASEGESC